MHERRIDKASATFAELVSAITYGEPVVFETGVRDDVAPRPALQSALLLRFNEWIDVEAADDTAWVRILHRRDGAMVTLVRLADLSPEAQATVGLLLRGPRPRHEHFLPDVQGDPVEVARTALLTHDYERARAALGPWIRSRRDALHLELDILVNYLGLHAEAIELGANRVSKDDPKVRHYLALAAANTGDLKQAEALSRGLPPELLVDVAIARARAAMRSSAPESTVRALTELDEVRPNHPILQHLRARFLVVRATAIDEISTRLDVALERNQLDHVIDESRQLRRWIAEHPLLTLADQQVREARSAPVVHALQRDAEAARHSGDVDGLGALLARVPPELRTDTAWTDLFQWQEAAVRAREDARLIDAMCRHDVDAIRISLDLPLAERRALGEEAGLILLMYTPSVPNGRAARQRFAEAAVALATAPAVDDPLAMWDHLEPHLPSLKHSGHVSDFLDDLDQRRRATIDRLANQWRVERARATNRAEYAELISEAALLHPTVQLALAEEVAELHALLQTRRTWHRHLERVRTALKADMPWRAAIASSTMALHPAPMDARSPWPDVRRAVQLLRTTTALGRLPRALRRLPTPRSTLGSCWSRNHRYRHIVTEQGPTLVLVREDHESQDATVLVLRVPRGERLIHARLDRNRWWVFTDATAMEFHPRSLDLLSATRHTAASSGLGTVETITPFGDDGWLLQGSARYGVWSAARPGSPLQLPEDVFFAVGGPVRGTGVVGSTAGDRAIVLSADPHGPLRPLGQLPCEAVAAHPDGGLLAFLVDDDAATGWLYSVRNDRSSRIAELTPPPGGLDLMVVESSTRTLFIRAVGMLRMYRIAANGTLSHVRQFPIPAGASLETDELGGRVQVVMPDGSRWRPTDPPAETMTTLAMPDWRHFPVMLSADDPISTLISEGRYREAAHQIEAELQSAHASVLFERSQQLVGALLLDRQYAGAVDVVDLGVRWTPSEQARMDVLRRWTHAITGELSSSEPERRWLDLARAAWQAHVEGHSTVVVELLDRLERDHGLDATTRLMRASAWLHLDPTTETDRVRRLAALGEGCGSAILGPRVPDPEVSLSYSMMEAVAHECARALFRQV